MNKLFFLILFCGFFAYPPIAFCQRIFNANNNSSDLRIKAYARVVAVGGAKQYDVSTVFSEFCLQPKFSANKVHFFGDFRIREGVFFNEEKLQIEMKELYLGYSSNSVDVLLGNQIVNWGRSDGFNPTNVITPNNYFFLSPDPDDQKLSNLMLRANFRFGSYIDLDLIGIPMYRPSIYRYELFFANEQVLFASPSFPGKNLENGTLAGRLNFDYPAAGFSVSGSSGYSPFYAFDIQSINLNPDFSSSITYLPRTFRQNLIGADVTLPARRFNLRSEAAYRITRGYADSLFIPNPDLSYVAGIETSIAGITVILQYLGKFVINFQELNQPELEYNADPTTQLTYAEEMIRYESGVFIREIFDQQEENNHALAISLSNDFFYQTFNLEISTYYNFTSESYLFRPSLSWNISDVLSAKVGGTFMHGSRKSVFDYSAPVLNGIYCSLKAHFQK